MSKLISDLMAQSIVYIYHSYAISECRENDFIMSNDYRRKCLNDELLLEPDNSMSIVMCDLKGHVIV